MPFQYARDDIRHRVNIILTSPVTLAELVASVDRQFADGAWRYGVLADGRRILRGLPPREIPLLVSHVRELVAAHGPRGPVAFVAKESEAISAAQIYLVLGGKAIDDLEVFWDPDEARQWLDRKDQGREPPHSS